MVTRQLAGWLSRRRDVALFVLSCLLLLTGVTAFLAGGERWAQALWVAAAVFGLAHSTATLAGAFLRRQPSVDIIAWLALAGSLLVWKTFAGAVITLMLASGVLLEARAGARARRDLRALAERAPRTARRRTAAGYVEIPVDDVAVGDRLLVGSGEIVPVDGRLLMHAALDESALTGEPLPVERRPGEDVRSGVVNAGSPVELAATATAAASTYAGLVRLAEQARADSAPFVRLADRFAVAFVPLTLLVAAGAWALSGEAVRAVAVLVVATPCPLLLAAPIAIVSGLSRAARVGVIVKGGSALERLAAGRVLLFDKTGTLTYGRATLTGIITADAGPVPDELLRLAASLDQSSAHVLAGAIVTAARDRRLDLATPRHVHERHGYGIEGLVEGRRVAIGKASWIVPGHAPAWVRQARRRAALDGTQTVFVSVDSVPSGALLLEDTVRPQAPRMVRALRGAGIARVVLLTGDRPDMAHAVGRIVGVDVVHADCDPAGKLAIVREESAEAPTIMVGDGINDAPALAAANVGVALAARGATASADAADIVLAVDRVDALAEAILVARRSRRIAVSAVVTGMVLSLAAMAAAAAGLLQPAGGALLQELIDVLAIGIALTAALPGRRHTSAMQPADIAVAERLYAEHQAVRPLVEQVRAAADRLTGANGDIEDLRSLLGRLENELLPHERAEEAQLLPIVARVLGGIDPTGALSRTHAEIEHQISRLRHVLEGVDGGVDADDVVEIRRLLYGLYAILRLHNAQEEEGAFSLVPEYEVRRAG